MDLLPEVNKDATVSRVRHFFRDDDQLPQLKRLAGAFGELKSPTFDITGVHGSGGNATEARYIRHAHYYRLYRVVLDAIKGCSQDSQTIINAKYLSNTYSWQVAQQMNIEKTAFNQKDRYACFEFADCLEGKAMQYSIPEKDLPDLHVYYLPESNRNFAGSLAEK